MSRVRMIEECREAIEAEKRAMEQQHLKDLAWYKEKLTTEAVRTEPSNRLVTEQLVPKTTAAQKLAGGAERSVTKEITHQRSTITDTKPSTATEQPVVRGRGSVQTRKMTATTSASDTKLATTYTPGAIVPTKSSATNTPIAVESKTTSPSPSKLNPAAKPFNGSLDISGDRHGLNRPGNETLQLDLSRHQSDELVGVHDISGSQLAADETSTIDQLGILQSSNPPRQKLDMIMTEFGPREEIRDTPRLPGQTSVFTDKHLDVNDAYRAAQKADMERFNFKGLSASRHASHHVNA